MKIILTPSEIKENTTARKEKPNKAEAKALNEAEVPISNNSTTTNKGNWSLVSPDTNILSPTCVDVTKLCDFINGGFDDEIDSWLSDGTPCDVDRDDVMVDDESKENVVLDCNERRENCKNNNKQKGDECRCDQIM